MREHLVFLLSGPMASFGGYAGHERRGSGLVPMRSAVLGLVGAALGIRPDRRRRIRRRFARIPWPCSRFNNQLPLRDFHTVQTVPTARAKRPPTRERALERAGRDVNTSDHHSRLSVRRIGRCRAVGRWPLAPRFFCGAHAASGVSPLSRSQVMPSGKSPKPQRGDDDRAGRGTGSHRNSRMAAPRMVVRTRTWAISRLYRPGRRL